MSDLGAGLEAQKPKRLLRCTECGLRDAEFRRDRRAVLNARHQRRISSRANSSIASRKLRLPGTSSSSLTIFSSVAASIWRRRAFAISRIASLDAVIGERSRPIGSAVEAGRPHPQVSTRLLLYPADPLRPGAYGTCPCSSFQMPTCDKTPPARAIGSGSWADRT